MLWALIVALSCGLTWSLLKIQALESTIEALQSSPKQKQDEPKAGPSPSSAREREVAQVHERERPAETPISVPGSYQILKELETDPRPRGEKLQELLAGNPTDEQAAIACRFIFDNATDAQGLPDYVLQAIYANQTNPDLKRVIAQVLSQRGNDALLNNLIAEAQATLKSPRPKDRLDTLNQLGKIHSVHAVDAIAPFLQDSDSTVRVAALFALRDSGNQRHVSLVQPLTHDPDPSVNALAGNVVSSLRNLSSSARTSYSRADIEAELPPIANP